LTDTKVDKLIKELRNISVETLQKKLYFRWGFLKEVVIIPDRPSHNGGFSKPLICASGF